jgi:hypothetical protein
VNSIFSNSRDLLIRTAGVQRLSRRVTDASKANNYYQQDSNSSKQYSKATGLETIAIRHSKGKKELACKLVAESGVSDGEGLLKEGQHDGAGGADVILTTTSIG